MARGSWPRRAAGSAEPGAQEAPRGTACCSCRRLLLSSRGRVWPWRAAATVSPTCGLGSAG
ncbi:unnamed protein product, partial [Rangifer tarandus platyrhynchus]